jgi:hypothetical protein
VSKETRRKNSFSLDIERFWREEKRFLSLHKRFWREENKFL